MNAKATEARRAYKRNWAKNNPDKVRAAQERYWERRAAAAEADSIHINDSLHKEGDGNNQFSSPIQ